MRRSPKLAINARSAINLRTASSGKLLSSNPTDSSPPTSPAASGGSGLVATTPGRGLATLSQKAAGAHPPNRAALHSTRAQRTARALARVIRAAQMEPGEARLASHMRNQKSLRQHGIRTAAIAAPLGRRTRVSASWSRPDAHMEAPRGLGARLGHWAPPYRHTKHPATVSSSRS